MLDPSQVEKDEQQMNDEAPASEQRIDHLEETIKLLVTALQEQEKKQIKSLFDKLKQL